MFQPHLRGRESRRAQRLPAVCRALLAGALVVLPASVAQAQDPSPTDLDWLRGEVGDAALAYQSGGTIYLTELSTGDTETVGAGEQPEISPDSSKLAWIDGTSVKGRMRQGDTTVHTITTGVTASGGVHWFDDDEVLVVKGGKWYRVSLSGAESEVVDLTALGGGGTEADVRRGGDGVWALVSGETWSTSEGDSGGTGGTCSSSLSPDGRSVTGLTHGHKVCMLTQIRPGGVSGQLDWVYDFNGEKGFDNHRWSSNDGRFVAVQDEKYNSMFVMKVGGTYGTRMGLPGSGEMYGDFSVGDGSGAPWPGVGGEPVLRLDATSIRFTAEHGGSNPSPRNIGASNDGGGVLAAVTTSVSYTQGSNWLAVTASGSGNSQTLQNGIDLGGLSIGSYTATVTVTASNAGASQSYDVELVVDAVVTNAAPVADAGFDQLIELGTPAFLYGSAADDGLPDGNTLTYSWSSVAGPDTPTVENSNAAETRVEFVSVGVFTLRLTVSDGALEDYDDVEITVSEQPSILILSPQPGDELVAGSTHLITWDTVNLEDVQIDFSCDDGQSWNNITGSVDTSSTHWRAFPWIVPSEPSAVCRIQIVGYFGEAPTIMNGPFSIIADVSGGAATPGGGPVAVEGSLACASSGRSVAVPWLGLALLLTGLRRRRR